MTWRQSPERSKKQLESHPALRAWNHRIRIKIDTGCDPVIEKSALSRSAYATFVLVFLDLFHPGTTENTMIRRVIVIWVSDTVAPATPLLLELEDSRRAGFDFPPSVRQDNHTDFLQAYAELYLMNGIAGQTTSLQAGRFTIDAVDRRLVGRNRFRNSANTFDGVRFRVGDEKSRWVANFFATRPVEPREGSFDDRSREERTLYGAYGTFRSHSPSFVFEPYYFYLDDERNPGRERQLHTAGAHAYGLLGDGSYDYDLTASFQWGDLKGLDHFASFFHAELGCTFAHPWSPRVSAWLNYGSGDDDPNDQDSGRFTELFGPPFGLYGFTRYFTAENTINPALSLSFKPAADVKVEFYLRSYSLASDTDAWVRGGRRDSSGGSGRHIGEELDFRLRWQITDRLLINTGVAHFIPGSFVDRTGLSKTSTLGYLQAKLDF